ncbi:hypothetical protein MTO96_022837 [Rhipicephalus appendiculatus]
MSKISAKRKSSCASASIPAVQRVDPRPQPTVVQDASPETTKTTPAPPPLMSQTTSPAEQVGVEQRSRTLPAVAVFLGVAIAASLLALVVVALLRSAKAGRSSRNTSSFCCVSEALVVLSVVNSSISPCEDFYAHVCSRADADAAFYLSPAFRVATNRRLLESSAFGTDGTAAGRLLDSLNDRFFSDDTPFDEDVADFATAILGTGLVDRRMNSSRMARFFAELSVRIDEDAPGQMTDVPCQVLQVCELEDRLVTDMVRSARMDNRIQSVFSKTRTAVIRRAKGHPMFEATSERELSNEMSKLRLVLPQEIVVSDIPIPTVSNTFAANLLRARSYIYDVRRAKVARNVPSAENLFLPALFRHRDVIYFPTNLYVLLNQAPNATGALDIPAFGVGMAAQMWTFLLESPCLVLGKTISRSNKAG